jgi:peptidoglycan glycosyltransferase
VNSPIRKVAAGCLLLCLALLANATFVQAFQANELNKREGNRRVLIDEYSRERGPILVGEPPVAIAESSPVDGELGYLREYPEPELYAQLTGFYSFFYGRDGIERTQNDVLSGSADRWFFRRLIDMVTGEQPRGGGVKLTINPAAQEAAWDALGNNKGAVVAIEPSTGAILAMVSKPSYDPNPLASHDISTQQEAWAELEEDDDNPRANRAAAEILPPGSVFKLVTSAAALENGFEPDSVIPAPAEYDLPQSERTIPNYNGRSCGDNNETTLTNALRISCNTAFAFLGNELGLDVMRDQAEKFGFNSAPLANAEVRSVASNFPAEMDDPSLAQSAIGQRDIRATPLQIAMVSAAIANRGQLMNPYLVDELRGPDLVRVLEVTEPEVVSQAVSAETARQLTEMMVEVVENGTGTPAQISGIQVAGKTGTAQTGRDDPPYAWFTSFAPADNPQVAVAVVIEEAPDTARDDIAGGRLAAPIARAVMEAVLGS